MKLFEYEGKQLLRKYGIPVPEGFLSKELPVDIQYPLIAKVQVLTGGRGKLGGIVKVDEPSQYENTVDKLQSMTLKGENVAEVYMETPVDFESEIYVSLSIDRNRKIPVLLISKFGGVDIEVVNKENLLLLPINPLIGLQPYMLKQAALFTGLNDSKLSDLLTKVWKVFKEREASLVEINPLFLMSNGDFIAGDAKIILDNEVNVSDLRLLERSMNEFEGKCLALNTVGVLLEGDTAVITSGAGLGMATFDMLSESGHDILALVDLGGHVIHDEIGAQGLLGELKKLKPRRYFFNFYFQVASCSVLANAIAKELGNEQAEIVIRMNGRDYESARKVLEQYNNILVTKSLPEAKKLLDIKVG
ncbi:ATP-grasp domain-containing protein [Bacillus sp. FJAT-22090]|uniref:ATP-grasp domain-containing protein n=1 Tax=Bacillus sp. FJAT-22090 TaxID=1581038 RepID=UPI0011A3B759|nr:ATP-grasp domain-containing protein [Bacillus sp. FJAT-22090]